MSNQKDFSVAEFRLSNEKYFEYSNFVRKKSICLNQFYNNIYTNNTFYNNSNNIVNNSNKNEVEVEDCDEDSRSGAMPSFMTFYDHSMEYRKKLAHYAFAKQSSRVLCTDAYPKQRVDYVNLAAFKFENLKN